VPDSAQTQFAPAKINLFLHVGPLQSDGYHPVVSLMVFADVGDTLRLRGAAEMGFGLEGPFAGALGPKGDNLVLAARDRLLATLAAPPRSFHLTLDKQVPIAAGLGGGSADAAAALRLIGRHLAAAGLAGPDGETLTALARGLGADVAACLDAVPVIASGRGDLLAAAPLLPTLAGVLVNPRAPAPTGAVYGAFDAAGSPGRADAPVLPPRFDTAEQVVAFLEQTRNDLEAPALTVQPAIGAVLAALTASPEALLARMSGSGATCFALCAGPGPAGRLAARLAADHPTWWVRPCALAGQGLRNR